jgi:hypothetical protein
MTSRTTAMLAIFVGPVAAAIAQLVSYALVHRAAVQGSRDMSPGVTAVAASAVLIGLFLSWRAFRWRGGVQSTEVEGVDRFLAAVGVAMNLFFLFVIVAGFGLPQLILDPVD